LPIWACAYLPLNTAALAAKINRRRKCMAAMFVFIGIKIYFVIENMDR
jgi:hypothetical protein